MQSSPTVRECSVLQLKAFRCFFSRGAGGWAGGDVTRLDAAWHYPDSLHGLDMGSGGVNDFAFWLVGDGAEEGGARTVLDVSLGRGGEGEGEGGWYSVLHAEAVVDSEEGSGLGVR
eukprot:549041-Rhodomonas_salina.3